MPAQDPLIFIHSEYDHACGVLPIALAVQSAADLGYRVSALVDEGTLIGVPRFLSECRMRQITPLVGMTVSVHLEKKVVPPSPEDIFDLHDLQASTPHEKPAIEKVVLLALHREGYQNLLSLKACVDSSPDQSISAEDLLSLRQGLFLVAGPPGSGWHGSNLFDIPRESIRILSPVIRSWPPDCIAYGGLFHQGSEGLIGKQLAQLASLSAPMNPIACSWFYYRNENDRFWGAAAAAVRNAPRSYCALLRGRAPRADKILRLLQGMTSAFRAVDRLASNGFEPIGRKGFGFPLYPFPRGTDIASLLWTVVQETAIQTGHIHVDGGKERLMEEFQFLKQTKIPTLWMILWDIRRKIGLPPGTLRPTAEWIGSSLFAHLLGLTRIDPLREKMPFQPFLESEAWGFHGGVVDIECPQGWESQILSRVKALLGEDHCGWCESDRLTSQQLSRAGRTILRSWEEYEFSGDVPSDLPPLPSNIRSSESALNNAPPRVLLLSQTNLKPYLAQGRSGLSSLDFDEADCALVGGLGLRFLASDKQTLIASSCYREAEHPARPDSKFESISRWIEDHRGEKFLGKEYGDDSGRLDMAGLCSSWLRLATIPGSSGYRPLLWKWIHETTPRSLGELADLMGLQWHWSFWGPRDWKRECLVARKHPLRAEEINPPWWQDWQAFLEEVQLPPKVGGDLGAALERVTSSTGGFLLYQEQLDAFAGSAFQLSGSSWRKWLETEPNDSGASPIESEHLFYYLPGFRKSFIQFLGSPFPLPSRMEMLFKAECILGLADAFAEDPCAFICLSSFLYPDMRIERRDLYAFLRARGFDLHPPKLQAGGRYDHSLSPDSLTLGSYAVYGIGEHLADDLEHPFPEESRIPSIRNLFDPVEVHLPGSFQAWLEGWKENRISWALLQDLIQLGFFENLDTDRGRLLEEAQAHRMKSNSFSRPVQESFLNLLDASSIESTEPGEALPIQSSVKTLERLPIPENPFRDFDAWFAMPQGEREAKLASRRGLLMGWMTEVDLFPSSLDAATDLERWQATGLLFTHNQACRLVDSKGLLAEVLLPRLNEAPRSDGHRIHLREPLALLVATSPLPQPTGHFIERFHLEAWETPRSIQEQSQAWARILIHVREMNHQLLESLPVLLEIFAAREGGIPAGVASSAGFLKRSNVSRLIQTIGTAVVVPSCVLVHSIGKIPGVESVEIDRPSNQLLF